MATIGLAKIIQEKDSLFWETCLKVRSLKTCADFLKSEEYFFCAPQASSSLKYTPISLLTMNPAENKELAFFDLNHDPEQHLETRVSGITSLIQSKQRVIRIIKGNRFPIMLNKDYLKNIDCFKELANNTSFTERAKKIRSSENFIENVKQSLVDRWEEKQLVPSDNLEEQLYGGPRLNPDDQEKIKEFNDSTEPVAKLKASSKINDSRYKQHANRVMYEEYPDELTIRQKQKHQKIIAEKALSENKNVKWMTIPKAKGILDSVKEDERYQKQKDYIGQIEEYIKLEEKKYKKYCN
jgi:exonuclease I